MRWFVVVAALAATAACSKKSEPAPRPVANAAAPQKTAPAVWSVSITTMGGFGGHGKGAITMKSDGAVLTSSHCKPAATAAQRAAVENAIANARPASWQASYRRADPSRMTDQFSYSLSLTAGDQKGAAAWRDDSFELLPADLRALFDAVWTVKEAVRQQCP